MKRAITWKIVPLWLGVGALLAACGGGGDDPSDSSSSLMRMQAGHPTAPADGAGDDEPTHGQAVSALAHGITSPGAGLDRDKHAALVAFASGKNKGKKDKDKDAKEAVGLMLSLSYANPQNWTRRVVTSTEKQSKKHLFVDRRQRSNAGAVAQWSAGGEPVRQSDFHFNGQAWVQCGLNQEHASSSWDAEGRGTYNYCDGREIGNNQRTVVDVSGNRMIDVYNEIRGLGLGNVTIAGAEAALGEARFPAEAALVLQQNTPTSLAVSYYPGIGNAVRNAHAEVASGVLASCLTISNSTPPPTYTSYAATLEAVVAGNRGTPCVYQGFAPTPAGIPLPPPGSPNAWWSQSTVSIGLLPPVSGPPTSNTHYTGNRILRAAFGAGATVRYYACQQRYDGSARNCGQIGAGNYTIEARGDGRIMRLAGAPAEVAALPYERVFVERGGKVYQGFQNYIGTGHTARLNLPAFNAMAVQLGLPVVDPGVPLVPTPASYQGEWMLAAAGGVDTDDGLNVILPANNTAPQCRLNLTHEPLACGEFSINAAGEFRLVTPDDIIQGMLRLVAGTAAGTLSPPPGSSALVEPMEGVRR